MTNRNQAEFPLPDSSVSRRTLLAFACASVAGIAIEWPATVFPATRTDRRRNNLHLNTSIMTSSDTTPYPVRTQTLVSQHDFPTTVARLTAVLSARNITVFADIDQSDAAVRAGTSLRPTRLILFGNPTGGTPVMQMNPHAALELPLRAVIWEDEDHIAHIDFLDVSRVLVEEYGVPRDTAAPLAAVRALLEGVVAA
jgi:uncharacterized protein (DUF302 family)